MVCINKRRKNKIPKDDINGWLSNFETEDLRAAELLIEKIRIFSSDDVSADLLSLTEDRRKEALDHGENYISYPVTPVTTRKCCVLETRLESKLYPVVFIDMDPTRPTFFDDLGSEGKVGKILRDQKNNARAIEAPNNIERIRPLRKRGSSLKISFVTDMSITGNEVLEYLECWARNSTVRSWVSFGNLSFEVLSHSLSSEAKYLIENHRLRPETFACESPLFLSDCGLKEREQEMIKRLARKYSAARMPWGYGKKFSLDLYSEGTPNTSPDIFWQYQRGGYRWTPLAPQRRIHNLVSQLEQFNRNDVLEVLSELEKANVSGEEYRFSNSRWRKAVLGELRNLGWISLSGEVLTSVGEQALFDLRMRSAQSKNSSRNLRGTASSMYTPRQLRRPRIN